MIEKLESDAPNRAERKKLWLPPIFCVVEDQKRIWKSKKAACEGWWRRW